MNLKLGYLPLILVSTSFAVPPRKHGHQSLVRPAREQRSLVQTRQAGHGNYCGYYALHNGLCVTMRTDNEVKNRTLFEARLAQWKAVISARRNSSVVGDLYATEIEVLMRPYEQLPMIVVDSQEFEPTVRQRLFAYDLFTCPDDTQEFAVILNTGIDKVATKANQSYHWVLVSLRNTNTEDFRIFDSCGHELSPVYKALAKKLVAQLKKDYESLKRFLQENGIEFEHLSRVERTRLIEQISLIVPQDLYQATSSNV